MTDATVNDLKQGDSRPHVTIAGTRMFAGRFEYRYETTPSGSGTHVRAGDYLVICKPDGSILLHDGWGYAPQAWLTRPDEWSLTPTDSPIVEALDRTPRVGARGGTDRLTVRPLGPFTTHELRGQRGLTLDGRAAAAALREQGEVTRQRVGALAEQFENGEVTRERIERTASEVRELRQLLREVEPTV